MRRGSRTAGAVALLAAALVAGAAAGADRDDDAVLPKGRVGVWSAERLDPAEPPGLDGAIAQVREKGEGRFAVICERGEDKAVVAWRPPKAMRREVRALGDAVEIAFGFDRGESLTRTARWDEDGRYWRVRFGRDSRLADALRERLEMTVRVERVPGEAGSYTLKKSWRSIEAMFSICGI